ncbi:MAG TPA: hypothetical protein VG328_10300 [Stellaceae bacterium]|jgi:Flp pilus assembly pilin Flp|nr:hypothetical protein [Stellaceae bacterium]
MFHLITKDESGVSGAEYAVLLLLLVGGIVAGVNALSNATTGVFNNTANSISDAGASPTSATIVAAASDPTSSSIVAASDTTGSSSTAAASSSPPTPAISSPGNSAGAPGQEKQQQGASNAKPFAKGQNK